MATKQKSSATTDTEQKPICGIVMPISEIDGCSAAHWKDVEAIIKEAASAAGFEAKIVSESDDVGVIQQRIVQNLYEHEIIVCDVSAKNANVMFELGLRLAFDKPAIVLKDDKTSYSFDTSPIEHLEYPRDLRYSVIQKFKKQLADKISATVEAAKKDEYTTFLKHFGKFKVAGLETKEVSEQEYLAREFASLRNEMRAITRARSTDRLGLLAPSSTKHRSQTNILYQGIIEGLSQGAITEEDITQNNLSKILNFLEIEHHQHFNRRSELESAAKSALAKLRDK